MNIIVDSTFNPFSYRDLMQPVYDYKQAYEETEAQFADLVTQTEAWKDIANRENSPEAYAMYRSYADQLNAIVDDFSQGMNSRNRRQLLGMKRRYASEITPIAKADEAMKAANALRDQAGPDAIFEVGRYNSLDQFLHGQTANNKYESRKDITARTAALTQAVAQSIIEDPIIRQSMSPQFLEVIQKRGLGSLQELQAAIAGNPAAANRFAQIRNQMIDQVGGLDRFDAQGRAAVEGAINEGLYAGLNNYQTSLQQDGEYMTKAQRVNADQQQQQINLSRDRLNYEKEKDQEARDIASGKRPIEVRPDGTKVYLTRTGSTWTETPNQERETLSNGSQGYKYIGEDGKYYAASVAGATSLTYNGRTIKATPVYDGTYTRSAVSTISLNKDGTPATPKEETGTGGDIRGDAYGGHTLPKALRTIGGKAKQKGAPVLYFDAYWDDLSHGVEFHSERPSGINLTDAQGEVYDLEDYLSSNGNDAESSAYKEIASQLRAKGLRMSDMLLMKDYDTASDSHYILVPKGYDIDGNYIGLDESLITHERTSSSSSKKL